LTAFDYHWANSLVFTIANNTSERVHDIMWNMPLAQVFKMVALIYTANTGDDVMSHGEREVIRRQKQTFEELTLV